MKRDQTVKIVAAMAVLAILAQLRLAAQDQPQSPQPTQQKEERARNTLAAANYNLRIASAFLCDPSESPPARPRLERRTGKASRSVGPERAAQPASPLRPPALSPSRTDTSSPSASGRQPAS